MATDTRRQQLKLTADRIGKCRQCPGMNEPGVTVSAAGFGSPISPVAIVGQSLCRKCMESGIPFTGGSSGYIDDALELARRKKRDLFITNVVHCHPPKTGPRISTRSTTVGTSSMRSWTSSGRDWSSVWVRMRRR
jgi:DNA polymerase